MKKLVFDYAMKLSFSAPVTDHRFQLRCVPASGPRQQVVDVKVRVSPETTLESQADAFDSVVMTGYIPQPHDSFEYSVTGIAFVDNDHTKPEEYKPLYRFDSALTIPGPSILALIERCQADITGADASQGQSDAVESALGRRRSPDSSVVDDAKLVMQRVFDAFTYTPGLTTIRTTAEEALTQGKGVCQDYAHAMLAVCRHLGMPARYIAGLLGGEGATHAWVEVYDHDRWIGLDPTHNRLVNDEYITIAHGRDYRDCMLDIGIFSGANVTQEQWVNASVHEQRV
ncbi:transglutaminase family protein [Bifidobacterium crudilactis]|uniref:transglutaminase family protein n=1 Tax=Bifidobacterium crudilactis TaxID=327277 RepID=UPI002357FB87|nr:transglutaminase family protein [Bifidobacterium crudilactis]